MHCLLGQNGAGKSTLIKVLAGAHRPDAGEITWQGEPVALTTPDAAISLGIATIYQELDLVAGPERGREHLPRTRAVARPAFSARGDARKAARDLLARLVTRRSVSTERSARSQPPDKQIVSMARALSHDARLIVMDEPSAVLDQERSRTCSE